MAFALLAIVSGPISFGIFPRSSLLTILFVGGWSLFAGAIIFVFILHTVRQLNLVNQIYRRATRINLLELKSVYALSALTARAGLGLIFFLYFAFAINNLGNFSINTDQLTFILYGGLFLTGIAAFVLPLRGIHRRLVVEKDLKLHEVNDRFAAAVAKLHQDVDTGNFDKMDGIHKAVASLVLEREQLEKISTWPWEKVTLRAFVTAIMIPIVLWLLTRLLDRLLNF
jgi:hypothetical protein